jgi:hypothetical protein
MDALLLCIERDGVLVTEDFNLRISARENGLNTIGTQAILIKLKDRHRLSSGQYSAIIGRKIFENHWYINLSSEDLIHWALLSKSRTSPMARAAFRKFEDPKSDFQSSFQVCCEFIVRASQEFSPKLVGVYANLIRRSLAEGREPSVVNALTYRMKELLEQIYGPAGNKLARETRRKFGIFFDT